MKNRIYIQKDLPEGLSFEGMVWLSHEPKPRPDKNPAQWLEAKNPFLLEGHWKATNEDNLYVTARGTGDKIYLTLINMNDIPPDHITRQAFTAVPAAESLGEAITLWEPTVDAACNNFNVLMPVLTFIQIP